MMTAERRSPLSVVVMTFNEELNLEKCLASVAGWADDLHVVDSHSTDGTLAIASRFGASIHVHAYESHPHQWSWALSTVPLRHDWVLALDADFVVTNALRDAIDQALATTSEEPGGYLVRHRQVFRGRFLRHGGVYPRYWLRLFRRSRVYLDEHDLVDLHFYVHGKTGVLEHDVIEDNWKEREFAFWVRKQIAFAQRQAVEEIRRERLGSPATGDPSLFSTPDRRILWLKRLWARLPLYVRPVLYFLYRYIARLGFLDGKEGLLYHVSQALFYRLMVDARIEELREAAPSPPAEAADARPASSSVVAS